MALTKQEEFTTEQYNEKLDKERARFKSWKTDVKAAADEIEKAYAKAAYEAAKAMNDALAENAAEQRKGTELLANESRTTKIQQDKKYYAEANKLYQDHARFIESEKEKIRKKDEAYEAALKELEKQKQQAQKEGDELLYKDLEKQYQKKLKLKEKNQKAETKLDEKFEKQRDRKKRQLESKEKHDTQVKAGKDAMSSGSALLHATGNLAKGIFNNFKDPDKKLSEKISGSIGDTVNMLSGMAQALDVKIDEIAGKKSSIDTRLQGWTMSGRNGRAANLQRLLGGGSYWDQMSKDMIGIAGVSRFITQEKFGANISSMVEKGIAANVEQRAFLATISDKIATTFDATNGTLLRLVRIQQQDTTASRLGMEAALNSFLNSMYENTEYMKTVSEGVKINLEESMALMSGKSAVGYEYQVQKWLGSLYSVGLSQGAITGISSAFGNLSAGKIEGITGGNTGNLMIMAANNANLSIAELLAKGMDESSTNQLMQAMVDYLAKLYNESKDSRVVQQQIANVYGLSASDLKAAASLARSTGAISNNFVNYSTGLDVLTAMSASMGKRISLGEQMKNVWSNLQYSMASGIASNPALYGIYKVAGLMRDTGAQMDIPAFSVMGNMIDLHTSVADLMSAGALAGGLISNIGNLASAFAGNASGAAMLAASGALWNNSIHRGGNGGIISSSGATVSESGMVGNASSSDVQNKTMNDANDDANQQFEEQKDESEEKTLTDVNESVLMIYDLLQSLVDGTNTITVKQELSGLLSAVNPFE